MVLINLITYLYYAYANYVHYVHIHTTLEYRRLTKTKQKQGNHKTIGMGNGNGLAGYGFENSNFGCCASRQSKFKSQLEELELWLRLGN